jgi:hypothetical protein
MSKSIRVKTELASKDSPAPSGANIVRPIMHNITITGYQFSASGVWMPSAETVGTPIAETIEVIGWAEALVYVTITAGPPQFDGTKINGVVGPFPTNTLLGPQNSNGNFEKGSAIDSVDFGDIAVCIMKWNAPGKDSQAFTREDLSIAIPAGSYIIGHIDYAAGDPQILLNAEMQCVIDYEEWG